MKNIQRHGKKKNLDVLRGIGITGIVLYHLFPSVFPGGFLGVLLFFILSGYLMFHTSERNWKQKNFHIGSYYKKRFLKIMPPLFTMVMIVCCYLTLTHSKQMTGIRQEICSIFLGCDNWWQIKQHASYFSKLGNASPFTHLWFLAVEIQFYLLWPFLFLLYQKGCQLIGSRKMCFFFLALALLSAGKMYALYTPGEDPSRVYYGTDTMAFSLFLGMFLGAFKKNYSGLARPIAKTELAFFPILILIICVLFLTIDGRYSFLYKGGMFVISFLFAFLIYLSEAQTVSKRKLPENSLLSLLGQKSYSIYLWHYPIIFLAALPL